MVPLGMYISPRSRAASGTVLKKIRISSGTFLSSLLSMLHKGLLPRSNIFLRLNCPQEPCGWYLLIRGSWVTERLRMSVRAAHRSPSVSFASFLLLTSLTSQFTEVYKPSLSYCIMLMALVCEIPHKRAQHF